MNENDFIFGRNSDGTLEVAVTFPKGKKYKVSAKSKDLLRVSPDTIDQSNNQCNVDTSALDEGDEFKLVFTEDDGAPNPAHWEFTIKVPGLPKQLVTDQMVAIEPSKPLYKRVWVLVTSLVVLLSLGCCTVLKTGKFWNKNPKVEIGGSVSNEPTPPSDTTPHVETVAVTNHMVVTNTLDRVTELTQVWITNTVNVTNVMIKTNTARLSPILQTLQGTNGPGQVNVQIPEGYSQAPHSYLLIAGRDNNLTMVVTNQVVDIPKAKTEARPTLHKVAVGQETVVLEPGDMALVPKSDGKKPSLKTDVGKSDMLEIWDNDDPNQPMRLGNKSPNSELKVYLSNWP